MPSCTPAYPCCVPCDPCPAPLPQGPPFSFTKNELDTMPQCSRPSYTQETRYITVQQPPRMVVKKRTVYVKRIFFDPKVVNCQEKYSYPKITCCEKVVRIPVIRYHTEVVKEPKITWFQSYVPEPFVISIPRIIIQPKEVCQTLLCQPKPQVVDVPEPPYYCVYPAEDEKMRCSLPCAPYPCPPTGAYSIRKPEPFPRRPCIPSTPCLPRDPCGPCPPSGPCSPCGPCIPCEPVGPCGAPMGPCLPFDVYCSGSPCNGPCGPCRPPCSPCNPCGPCPPQVPC